VTPNGSIFSGRPYFERKCVRASIRLAPGSRMNSMSSGVLTPNGSSILKCKSASIYVRKRSTTPLSKVSSMAAPEVGVEDVRGYVP
jgi:hypothetical protein